MSAVREAVKLWRELSSLSNLVRKGDYYAQGRWDTGKLRGDLDIMKRAVPLRGFRYGEMILADARELMGDTRWQDYMRPNGEWSMDIEGLADELTLASLARSL